FSEVPIGSLASLEEFLKRAMRNPLEEARERLAKVTDAERAVILRVAQEQARGWRLPTPGTAAFLSARCSAEEGQMQAFRAGLSVHPPDIDDRGVLALYRQLQRDTLREARRTGGSGEGMVTRLYSVIFGFGDPAAREEEPLPEASAPIRLRPTG